MGARVVRHGRVLLPNSRADQNQASLHAQGRDGADTVLIDSQSDVEGSHNEVILMGLLPRRAHMAYGLARAERTKTTISFMAWKPQGSPDQFLAPAHAHLMKHGRTGF